MESLSHTALKKVAKYFNLHNQIKRYTVISKDELIAELKKHLDIKDGMLVYKERTPFNKPLKAPKPTRNLFKESEQNENIMKKPKEKEEAPEFDELEEEDIKEYKELLDYYSENQKEFLELSKSKKENMIYYWNQAGFKIPKVLKDIYENNVVGSGKSKVCMPKSDYLAEHKHLNYLLSHPTQSGLQKEFAKQTKEVAMRGGSYALHAVIVHKPYPLEKAYQEAMNIMKVTKPKFMRETQQSYRFRNIPKTKFQSKSFRTKVINPNLSLVYGNLK
jgi:hypothetical protein